jgi:hypothetical protein
MTGPTAKPFTFTGAAGIERQIEPIVRRALDLVAERLPAYAAAALDLAALSVAPIRLDLAAGSDEDAADAIARALLDALALELDV